MAEFLEMLSLVCAAMFSGAAVYVSFVEHPARIQTGAEAAVNEFIPSYKRGAVMQATLSAVGLLSAIGAWLLGGSWIWLVGALFLGAPIVVTLLIIFPINARLLDSALNRSSGEALRLLIQWGRLHLIRSVLGFAALLILITAMRKG